MFPPSMMRLKVVTKKNRGSRISLWIPLFLIWLLLSILLLPLILVGLVIALFLIWTKEGRRWMRFAWGVYTLGCSLRGLVLEIEQPHEYIHIYLI